MEALRKGSRRMNVTFPANVAEDLERLVPRGERNRFVVEATERALRRERFMKALEESAGAWPDESYPNLRTAEDIDRFIRQIRETSPARTWDQIAEDDQA